MSRITAFFRKALALALLAATGAFVYVAAIAPAIERERALSDQLAEQRHLLGRLRTSLGEAGSRTAAPQAEHSVFLAGESDSIRIAGLQTLLGALAETAGARLQSTQIVEPRERAGVRLVGIEAQLAVGLESMQEILHGLETHEPPLFVDNLNIVAGAEADEVAPEKLTMRIVVLGAVPGTGG